MQDFRKIQRQCRQCEAQLVLKNKRDIDRKFYCSRICLGRENGSKAAGNLNPNVIRSCIRCGEQFTARIARHKYCSAECQLRAGYQAFRRRHSTLRGYLIRILRPRNRDHIDIDFLLEMFEKQNGRCAISGVPLTHTGGVGYVFTNVSIDQIKAGGGYTKDNIQLVCFIVNYMKRNMTVEQLVDWCRIIAEKHNATIVAGAK